MTEEALRCIGRFEQQEVLGTGAFATVYRASDERLGDTVALKVLAENHSLDPELRERFLTEGRVLRRVDSAHVVQVYDLGETELQQPYLVLEHAERGTLGDRVRELRAQGWYPQAADVRAVVRPLADAVAAMHRIDVVHRDLSPGNVLLCATVAPTQPPSHVVGHDERIVLADLGLCKDLGINSGYTAAGGTTGFRPPEQRYGPGVVDARADLWALSAMVVWLLTGSPPRDGESVRVEVLAAGFPEQLATVLDRSLAHEAEQRHSDVAAWLADLDAALPAAVAGSAVSEPMPPPARGPFARGPSRGLSWRKPLLLAGGVLFLVAAVGAGGYWLLANPTTTTSLGDGEVRVEHTSGPASLAIVGPSEVGVGEPAVFTAETEEIDEWFWISPEGELVPSSSGLQVDASSAGVAPVHLFGVGPDGELAEVRHDLRVTD